MTGKTEGRHVPGETSQFMEIILASIAPIVLWSHNLPMIDERRADHDPISIQCSVALRIFLHIRYLHSKYRDCRTPAQYCHSAR